MHLGILHGSVARAVKRCVVCGVLCAVGGWRARATGRFARLLRICLCGNPSQQIQQTAFRSACVRAPSTRGSRPAEAVVRELPGRVEPESWFCRRLGTKGRDMRTPNTHSLVFSSVLFFAIGKLGHTPRGQVPSSVVHVRQGEAGLFIKRRIADDEYRRMSQSVDGYR
jgi:hypothetical protein